MARVSVDDLQRAMKLLSLSLNEERFRIVAPFLSLTLEGLQPLTKQSLPKELEPTTYLARLKEVGRVKRHEDT
jgi:hypothetical protein